MGIIRLLSLLVLVLGGGTLLAQQLPQYSMHMNSFIYNPAIAGINNYMDVKTSLRQQYANVQGSPVTTYISAHKPINQKDLNKKELESLPQKGVSAVRFKISEQQKVRHALGGNLINDQAGLLERTSANMGYAVHIPWGRTFYASLGASIGVSNFRLSRPSTLINFNEVNTVDDRALLDGTSDFVFPEMNIGGWIYTPRYYVGLSTLQLLGNSLRFTGDDASFSLDNRAANLRNHFVLAGGYRFAIGTDIKLVPNFMLKYVNRVPPAIEGGVRAYYQDNVWGGLVYRFNDFTHQSSESVCLQFGLNINKLIELGFAYDYTLFDLNTDSRGSFEVVLGLRLFNKRNDDSRLW